MRPHPSRRQARGAGVCGGALGGRPLRRFQGRPADKAVRRGPPVQSLRYLAVGPCTRGIRVAVHAGERVQRAGETSQAKLKREQEMGKHHGGAPDFRHDDAPRTVDAHLPWPHVASGQIMGPLAIAGDARR